MKITHKEARHLIQSRADQALSADQNAMLSAHLQNCMECRAYVDDLKEVEGILLSVMKRQWARQPIPLSVASLLVKGNPKVQTRSIVATRTLMIGVVFLAFIFSAWQFTLSNQQMPGRLPAAVLTVATPSAQSTRTKSAPQNCGEMLYQVQQNDTLESIASRFSIPREQIIAINNLKTATLQPSMQLIVLMCKSTPTVTANPAPETTTFTPASRLMVSTPGG